MKQNRCARAHKPSCYNSIISISRLSQILSCSMPFRLTISLAAHAGPKATARASRFELNLWRVRTCIYRCIIRYNYKLYVINHFRIINTIEKKKLEMFELNPWTWFEPAGSYARSTDSSYAAFLHRCNTMLHASLAIGEAFIIGIDAFNRLGF